MQRVARVLTSEEGRVEGAAVGLLFRHIPVQCESLQYTKYGFSKEQRNLPEQGWNLV